MKNVPEVKVCTRGHARSFSGTGRLIRDQLLSLLMVYTEGAFLSELTAYYIRLRNYVQTEQLGNNDGRQQCGPARLRLKV